MERPLSSAAALQSLGRQMHGIITWGKLGTKGFVSNRGEGRLWESSCRSCPHQADGAHQAAWGSLEPMVAPGWRKPGELAAFLVLKSGGDIGMNQAAANFGFSLCSHG